MKEKYYRIIFLLDSFVQQLIYVDLKLTYNTHAVNMITVIWIVVWINLSGWEFQESEKISPQIKPVIHFVKQHRFICDNILIARPHLLQPSRVLMTNKHEYLTCKCVTIQVEIFAKIFIIHDLWSREIDNTKLWCIMSSRTYLLCIEYLIKYISD